MDKESIIEKLKEIGTVEDDAQRRDLLSELSEEIDSVFTNYSNMVEEDTKLKEENEKLTEYNRKLFMRVGDYNKTPEQVEKDTTGEEPEREPRKFENLFDEKGNLKI